MSAGQLPRWVDYGLIPFLNLAAAFLVSGLVVVLIGENPLDAVQLLVWGSIGYGEGIGFTLFYATNFIFTGLAVAVAFHAGLFNIGGEGQAYIGGLGVAIACLALDHIVPWYITLPFAIIGSALMGAAWAFIPAWLQATRGSHVVITTIMFNFIASSLMVYLLNNALKKPGSMQPETRTFEDGGRLPFLNDIFPSFGFGYAPVNLSLFVALAACVLVWFLIWRCGRLRLQLAVQRCSDQGTRFRDPVKCCEGAEARASFLTQKDLVEHLEESNRNTGAPIRTLALVVLIALDAAGHIQYGVLDRFAVGIRGQGGKGLVDPGQRFSFDLIRCTECLGWLYEILEIAQRVAGKAVELGMCLRCDTGRIARDEAPKDIRILRVGCADEIEQQRKWNREFCGRRIAVMNVPDGIAEPVLPVLTVIG